MHTGVGPSIADLIPTPHNLHSYILYSLCFKLHSLFCKGPQTGEGTAHFMGL
jgi:hypothetical protein